MLKEIEKHNIKIREFTKKLYLNSLKASRVEDERETTFKIKDVNNEITLEKGSEFIKFDKEDFIINGEFKVKTDNDSYILGIFKNNEAKEIQILKDGEKNIIKTSIDIRELEKLELENQSKKKEENSL
jgi:hypothetical protein